MTKNCSIEPKLTVDAAIARFINEDPADYAIKGDSFDVDDVPENCELVGPVSYERDILAGILLARTIREYKDRITHLEERLDRQAAWGKEKQTQITHLELKASELTSYAVDLEEERDGVLQRVNELLATNEASEIKYKEVLESLQVRFDWIKSFSCSTHNILGSILDRKEPESRSFEDQLKLIKILIKLAQNSLQAVKEI